MLFVYKSTNPCNCSGTTVISDPPCDDTCNCLKLCTIIIPSNSEEAVAPCGGELILDVADVQYEHDTCACGENTQKWYVAYFDPEVFESVTVSLNGDLNATTLSTPPGVLHSNIILKFVCGNLSTYLTIVVGIQDLCALAQCGPLETCDECTGVCEPNVDVGTE